MGTLETTELQRRPLVGRARLAGWPLVGLAIVLTVWQVIVSTGLLSALVLPPPLDVAREFVGRVVDPEFWGHARITVYETLAGYLLGAGTGFVIAVFSGLSAPFRKMVYPYMVALQVTPRIALAPIFVAWLGFGPAPKIVTAAVICFFVVFINTLAGLEGVDRNAAEMFRSLGATRVQTLGKLELPGALPVTFAGFKTAMTLALVGAIVAEFISSQQGLGLLMQRYAFQLETALVFATLLILMLLGLALFGLMELADRSIVFWRHDGRMSKRSERKRAAAAKQGLVADHQ
ncbi:MAG: ABC transporter permease subunit [Nitriliruptorales bacterium]|nr:ABC transporter permease subunit [Nitriliruptorales bacterium]